VQGRTRGLAAEMAEAGYGGNKGGGQARESPARGQPPATADPSALRHDRADIQRAAAQSAMVRRAGNLERLAEGVEIGHGRCLPIAGAGAMAGGIRVGGSAEIRSLASARELVLFTVPMEI